MSTEIFYCIKNIESEEVKFVSLKSEYSFSVAEGLASLETKHKGCKIRKVNKNELIALNLKQKSIVLHDVYENQFFKDLKKALQRLKSDKEPMIKFAKKYNLL